MKVLQALHDGVQMSDLRCCTVSGGTLCTSLWNCITWHLRSAASHQLTVPSYWYGSRAFAFTGPLACNSRPKHLAVTFLIAFLLLADMLKHFCFQHTNVNSTLDT